MDTTHLHLLLNHFPIIGTLIGSILLFFGIIKKQENIKTVASFILFVMAILAIPVFLTGEPAEESVEKLPGVLDSMIELHEEAANIAIWLMELTGFAALIALFLQKRKQDMAKTTFFVVFILSVICFAAMARTGYYGGKIRHSEIRTGSAESLQNGINNGNEAKGEKDDD